MSTELEQKIETALADLLDPNTGKSLHDSGFVHSVTDTAAGPELKIRFAYPLDESALADWRTRIETALAGDPALAAASISLDWKVNAHKVQGELKPLDSIRNIIVIASGKGGVGKSTTAVNLAVALQQQGARVGMLDADIYGPSLPRMLGLSGKPEVTGEKQFVPKMASGIPVMSMGFLIDEQTPMIWRGPMVTSALQQLLNDTNWSDNGEPLDYLIVDMPPGTGDIQLTLSQKIPVAAAIIVTTPQDIALLDARKGLEMFRKVNVQVLGVIENMSIHICASCGHEEAIFGSGGGEKMAQATGLPLMGQLPLDLRIRELSDIGACVVRDEPESAVAAAYTRAALRAVGELSQQPRNRSTGLPEFIVQS